MNYALTLVESSAPWRDEHCRALHLRQPTACTELSLGCMCLLFLGQWFKVSVASVGAEENHSPGKAKEFMDVHGNDVPKLNLDAAAGRKFFFLSQRNKSYYFRLAHPIVYIYNATCLQWFEKENFDKVKLINTASHSFWPTQAAGTIQQQYGSAV